jgi:DNA-binding NtrC family response regulator
MSTAPRQHAERGCVLVVDDHPQARESVADVLRQAGHQVDCCAGAAGALQAVEQKRYDCILTDLKMPGMSGLELIVQLEQRRCEAQVVMVTAHASVATAVEAMRHGAFDYIEKPFGADQIEQLVAQAIRQGRLLRPDFGTGAAAGPCGSPATPVMIGSSAAMQSLRAKIARIAPTPETVLVTGESGTGKELVARALHAASGRPPAAWVSVNCPALSANLMESELFGHVQGAFTGADRPRSGRFALAAGGTILLDEVTEIDLPLQAKLLRVLQEKSFEPVGSSESIESDARVLATTNRDLRAEVAAGRFREDLYYRLAVLPLHVPPLRQRKEDIPELIEYFLARSAQRLRREPCALEPDALELLVRYPWPGNVRELENIITRACVLNMGRPITREELGRSLSTELAPAGPPLAAVPVGLSLDEMERKMIEATLERFGGHRAKTAEALGIGVRTLTGKLRQYGYAPRARPTANAG